MNEAVRRAAQRLLIPISAGDREIEAFANPRDWSSGSERNCWRAHQRLEVLIANGVREIETSYPYLASCKSARPAVQE
mgnify:CR=1 FL=1